MNLGLNCCGNIFIKNSGCVIRTIASYSSVRIILWLLTQAFWKKVIVKCWAVLQSTYMYF